MDTSAGKATTKKQKKKFRAEGHCYKYERQGHMAWDCPTKTKVRSTEITEVQEKNKDKGAQAQPFYSVQDMITHATKFLDDERLAFILGLQKEDKDDEDLGFLEAWAKWP